MESHKILKVTALTLNIFWSSIFRFLCMLYYLDYQIRNFELSLTWGISNPWNISGSLNLRQSFCKKLRYLMYFIPRYFFEIFYNTLASQSWDSGSKAGCYSFNTAAIFVHIYTLSREFRHNLATLANDQLVAQILIHLIQSSTRRPTCFEQYLAHPQEVKLY